MEHHIKPTMNYSPDHIIFHWIHCWRYYNSNEKKTHFFLKILQRNSKLVILGNLGMLGHTHPQWWCQLEKTFTVYQQAKNQFHCLGFPWDIAKVLQNCYSGYFGHAWLCTNKAIYQLVENVSVNLQTKNQLHYPCSSGDISKICKLLILDTLKIPIYRNSKW